jgi:DNA polymerase-4
MTGDEWPHVYAHLDMDAFYVGVELQRRPELRGRPIVVAGTGPRAVVTTASYEARRFGIFSATPAARARRQCPDAIFVPPDFDAYRRRSREVMGVLREHFEVVEVVGLDEAYLDLSGYERPRSAARRARTAIRDRTGLGCSIGLGPSKLVAKVASDAEKPDGFVALTRAEARRRFAGSPPSLIPGIGPRTTERLASRGVTTLGALAETPDETLADWFGSRLGPYLGRVARFEDDRPLRTSRIAKSESRESTFSRDLRGLAALEPALRQLSADLCERLARRGGEGGRTIGIKVRLEDFSTHTRARTLERPTADRAVVADVATELLREFDPQRPVRLLGVRVAGLDEGRNAATPEQSVAQLGLPL